MVARDVAFGNQSVDSGIDSFSRSNAAASAAAAHHLASRRRLQADDPHTALPLLPLIVSRLTQGTCAISRRRRHLCILDATGQVLVHRNVPSTPAAFLETVAPYRDHLVVAAEHITFVLGHALAMKAIHGGKAKNDKIDSHKIAVLLRGGMLPQAYVYPAGMRSTRDLLRRRLHLVRTRGELLAHIQNTRAQYHLPECGRRLAYPGNREGVVDHVPDPSVRKSIEVDVTLIDQYDALVNDLELTIVREAKRHDGDANRVQEFASYARLIACAKESAGKKLGTSGAKMGNVHLTWAFSEAAVLFLRHTAEGKKLLARLEKNHGTGNALSILAHKIGRAVYDMLSRGTVFSMVRQRARVMGHPPSPRHASFAYPLDAAPPPSLETTDARRRRRLLEEAGRRARLSF